MATRLPAWPRGVAIARYAVSRRNRVACAWRSACAAAAALYTNLARRLAGF